MTAKTLFPDHDDLHCRTDCQSVLRGFEKASKIHRRRFLKRTVVAAAAAAPLVIPASALGRAGRIAPSERIALGAIGVGGMGFGDMSALMSVSGTQVVAVCDVKRAMRDRAKQMGGCRWDPAVEDDPARGVLHA